MYIRMMYILLLCIQLSKYRAPYRLGKMQYRALERLGKSRNHCAHAKMIIDTQLLLHLRSRPLRRQAAAMENAARRKLDGVATTASSVDPTVIMWRKARL